MSGVRHASITARRPALMQINFTDNRVRRP